jgi:SAM-dependent methyltransferase
MTKQVWNWSSLQRKSDSLMNKAYIKACERLILRAFILNPKSFHILDIGSGSGLVLRHINAIAKNPFNYLGTDLNPEGLEILKKRAKNLNILDRVETLSADCSIQNTDWKSKFDQVFSNFCLYTINDRQTRLSALKNIAYYLKPNGTFHIALPSDNYGANKIAIQCLIDELSDSQNLLLKFVRTIFLVPYQWFFVLRPIEKRVNNGDFVRFSQNQIEAEFSAAGLEINEIIIDYGGSGFHIHGKRAQ